MRVLPVALREVSYWLGIGAESKLCIVVSHIIHTGHGVVSCTGTVQTECKFHVKYF